MEVLMREAFLYTDFIGQGLGECSGCGLGTGAGYGLGFGYNDRTDIEMLYLGADCVKHLDQEMVPFNGWE